MKVAELIEALKTVRVVPVIDPKSKEECLAAVAGLVSGGATAIEITLRSDVAYATLPAVRAAYPEIIIGAGSVMNPETYDKAVELGSDFTISPGRCTTLEDYTRDGLVAHVPGVVTPTEIIAARQVGQLLLKFYPSEASGGAAALKDLGRIFPDVLMMPSGGIKENMLGAYAKLPGVLSVGGSWMYAEGGVYRELPDMARVMGRSIGIMCGNGF